MRLPGARGYVVANESHFKFCSFPVLVWLFGVICRRVCLSPATSPLGGKAKDKQMLRMVLREFPLFVFNLWSSFDLLQACPAIRSISRMRIGTNIWYYLSGTNCRTGW